MIPLLAWELVYKQFLLLIFMHYDIPHAILLGHFVFAGSPLFDTASMYTCVEYGLDTPYCTKVWHSFANPVVILTLAIECCGEDEGRVYL